VAIEYAPYAHHGQSPSRPAHRHAEVPAQQNSQYEGLNASIPLVRMGRRRRWRIGAVFLCSEEASYITGATLDVNGGCYIRA
jgi:NAD(P)-dependent dehydrogenase (short-subunit alcohol dehydrogenase family)